MSRSRPSKDLAALHAKHPVSQRLAEVRERWPRKLIVKGIVRGDDALTAMTLDHYPGMSEKEIAGHVAEAKRRWPILAVRVVHRVGRLTPGERIVFVGVSSAHRGAAFEAAEFLMDYLKTRAPFWKLEERASGSTWVEAKAADDKSAERWR